jgi:Uma2 family endonuclease
MVQAKPRFKTIEEYAALTTSDLPECRFELVNGEIIEIGAEARQNIEIASFLFAVLLQFVPFYLLHRGTEVEVISNYVTCREPDLMVLSEETRVAMQRDKRSIVTLTMPNPSLVVEVVSQGDETDPNYKRDYEQKPQEYAARGIPEYWRIDPQRNVVTVLVLQGFAYQEMDYRGSDRVYSPRFPTLQLTADQILNLGDG